MRSSSKSRSRNKNNNRNRSVGNIVNRVFDSAGPEGKVRGTPQQIIEKYQTLARDAQLSNDRVAAENFLQHSEHYARMLNEAMREQAERQEADRLAQEAQRQRDQEREAQRENGHDTSPEAPAEVEAPVYENGTNAAVMMPPLNGHDETEEPASLVETPEGAAADAPPPKKPRARRTRTKKAAAEEPAAPAPGDADTGSAAD
ncbi:MAG: DUF4167 domain-containing protein [Pseudomonadota bacterium]